MKKKVQLIGIVLFGLIISSFAGMYVGVAGGASFLSDSDLSESEGTLSFPYETGYNIEGVVGYAFEASWRAELALNWQENDFDFSDIPSGYGMSVLSLMANGYYDFKAGAGFTPYLFAGLGFLNGEIDFGKEFDDTVFAGQLGFGVGYAITEHVILDLKYKYFMSQDLKITDGTDSADVSLDGSQIQFGVRYQF